MPLLDLQVRFRELGRIRAGEKGSKGEPRKLSHWRLTSASSALLEQAATLYGGKPREWKGAPDEGYFELYTEADSLDVMIPPVADSGALLSQHYELWSGGGCVRRCDGVTEGISGGKCVCNPDDRDCKPTTRLSVMIPRLGGIGVWRLDTGGINAALELPGSFGLIVRAAEGQFMPATLRLEQRSKREGGTTKRYAVPVLDMEGVSMLALVSGEASQGVLGPAIASGRPALPSAGAPPSGEDASFSGEPAHGAPPALPSSGAEPQAPTASSSDDSASAPAPEPPPSPTAEAVPNDGSGISNAQRRRLFAIAREHGVEEVALRALISQLTGSESTAGMSVEHYESLVMLIESREPVEAGA